MFIPSLRLSPSRGCGEGTGHVRSPRPDAEREELAVQYRALGREGREGTTSSSGGSSPARTPGITPGEPLLKNEEAAHHRGVLGGGIGDLMAGITGKKPMPKAPCSCPRTCASCTWRETPCFSAGACTRT
mmetsp:Transcript_34355/g.108888  ORF Transcript_34355/g.108888 Transcript_34355/m.108888 type:complete len:130 (-) Transcript_34355:347-736(-)